MIVSDRDVKFTSNFWKKLFGDMDTKLNFTTTYHPQTDGKIERTNHILEEILKMYVMDRPTECEYFMHLADFSYSNSYQTSIKMNPFDPCMAENSIHHSVGVNKRIDSFSGQMHCRK